MKASVTINAMSRVKPSRPSSVRAEDSHYWAYQTRSPYHVLRILSATVVVGAIIATVTILRVWLVT
jgi:hypothetical protein